MDWVKSSFCSGGSCVEVAPCCGNVLVRDSKDTGGQVLSFDPSTWASFLEAVPDLDRELNAVT